MIMMNKMINELEIMLTRAECNACMADLDSVRDYWTGQVDALRAALKAVRS